MAGSLNPVSGPARHLWLLFFVHAVLVTVGLQVAGVPEGETIIRPLRRFLDGVQQTDSWRPMQAASAYLDRPGDRLVYDELLNVRRIKFQYPLSSLFVTRYFNLSVLNLISWVTVVAMIVVVWLILRRTGKSTPLELRGDDPTASLAIVGLTLTCLPIIEAYSLGQIQAWISLLLALAVFAWLVRQEDWAGVAVGVACLLKPTYLLLALWGVVRWRPRFVVSMVAVVCLGTLASVVAFGAAQNLDYFQALATIGRRGEAFHPNQSFNGLLNRLVGNGDSLRFDRAEFAPFDPIVYGGTLVAFLVFTGLSLWLPSRTSQAGGTTDFSIAMLTVTMTSPIAWTHHYGVLPAVLAATAPGLLVRAPFGRWTGATLFACYVVANQSLSGIFNRLADRLFNVLQSYVLIAVLLLIALLYASLLADRPSRAENSGHAGVGT